HGEGRPEVRRGRLALREKQCEAVVGFFDRLWPTPLRRYATLPPQAGEDLNVELYDPRILPHSWGRGTTGGGGGGGAISAVQKQKKVRKLSLPGLFLNCQGNYLPSIWRAMIAMAFW